jgi:putative redox protein
MSVYKIHVDWSGKGEVFTGHSPSGPPVAMDGNRLEGTSPMVLLLHAEAGCTGIDVISLLEKMRQPVAGLRIEVIGEKSEGDYPRMWDKIHLRYIIQGNVDREKAEKAVGLSMDKYCSVSAMLSRAAIITHEIILEP